MQEKFTNAIVGFDHISNTTQKLLKFAKIFNIPVYYTTQLRSKLGPTVDSLQVDGAAMDLDKSLFSMCLPDVLTHLPPSSKIAIVGIEAHICVSQTTIDLLKHGHEVYLISDGISSCNPQEVPIALRRLGKAGATVTTSESYIYEITRDAKVPEFKAVATLVKDSKEATKAALHSLSGCKI